MIYAVAVRPGAHIAMHLHPIDLVNKYKDKVK